MIRVSQNFVKASSRPLIFFGFYVYACMSDKEKQNLRSIEADGSRVVPSGDTHLWLNKSRFFSFVGMFSITVAKDGGLINLILLLQVGCCYQLATST